MDDLGQILLSKGTLMELPWIFPKRVSVFIFWHQTYYGEEKLGHGLGLVVCIVKEAWV